MNNSESFEDNQDQIPNQFFVNFGSISDSIPTLNKDKDINDSIRWNRRIYAGNHSQYHYTINGVLVTVYSFGIHRAMHLQLPDKASKDTQQAYNNAYNAACGLKPDEYALLSYNCVTAVAKVLHELDKTIDPTTWVPFWQYSHLDRPLTHTYPSTYQTESLRAHPKTQKQESPEFTSPPMFNIFMKLYNGSYWRKDNQPRSYIEIIDHAMGVHPGKSGKKTKQVLIALQWVEEDKETGLLLPSKQSVSNLKQFHDTLNKYNQSEDCFIDCLKRWYKEAGGGLMAANLKIFDTQNVEEIIRKIIERSILHPNGASKKVCDRLNGIINNTNAPDRGYLSNNKNIITVINEITTRMFTPDQLKKNMNPDPTKEEKLHIMQVVQLSEAGRKDFNRVHIDFELDNYFSKAQKQKAYDFVRNKLNASQQYDYATRTIQNVKYNQEIFAQEYHIYVKTNLKDMDMSRYCYDDAKFINTDLTGVKIYSTDDLTKISAKNVICDNFFYDNKKIQSTDFIQEFQKNYHPNKSSSLSRLFSNRDPLMEILNDENKRNGTKVLAILSLGNKNLVGDVIKSLPIETSSSIDKPNA